MEKGRGLYLGVLVLVGVVDLRELAVRPADFLVGGVRREVEQRVELPPVLRLRRRRHPVVRRWRLAARCSLGAAARGGDFFLFDARVYAEFVFARSLADGFGLCFGNDLCFFFLRKWCSSTSAARRSMV